MARGFNHGLEPAPAPYTSSGVFYKNSRELPPAAPTPPTAPEPVLPAAIPSAGQLGGMLNGLMGSVFENNNWWLWAAALIILLNPDLRKKLIGKEKEAD